MPTVKILAEGGVGSYAKNEIVPNAHDGLVEMAENGSRNAATGELLVEFVEEVTDEFEALKTKAKELQIRGFGTMKFDTLKAAVEAAEAAQTTPDGDPKGDANGEPNPTE